MNKLLTFLASLVIAVLILGQAPLAAAHVLITDETGVRGLVLHVVPDDDPIAGQPSQLFFDLQAGGNKQAQNFTLTIQNAGSQGASDAQSVPLHRNNTTWQATYTFPAQGVYHLVLRSEQAPGVRFTYDLRVGRGELGNGAQEQPTPGWATTGVVLSSTGLLALVIVAWNNRKRIAEHSRTHR